MVRFRKNRESQVQGFSLTFKSGKNSSKRTVAAANLMEEARKEQVPSNTKKVRRHNKKEAKIGRILEIEANDSKSVPPEVAEGMTFGPDPDLDKYTTDTAKQHWLNREQGVFSVVAIPRESTLERVNEKNTMLTVKALEKLQETEKSCRRSATKTGTSTTGARYAIFGNKIFRGGHGFVHDKLSKLDSLAANTLRKLAGRMEDIVAEFVPSGWLRAISKANGFFSWPTFKKCKLVAAMASSLNYSAPAHVDDDFLFSIHLLNVDGRLHWDAVVQYMCFPTLGFAIGLRPGDVILFNPHVHHCLSEKTEAYNDVDVHVTTFYLKTAHVGKNDNTLPLTEQEEIYFDMKFKSSS